MQSIIVSFACERVDKNTFYIYSYKNVLLSTPLQPYKSAKIAFSTYNYILT